MGAFTCLHSSSFAAGLQFSWSDLLRFLAPVFKDMDIEALTFAFKDLFSIIAVAFNTHAGIRTLNAQAEEIAKRMTPRNASVDRYRVKRTRTVRLSKPNDIATLET